MSPKARAVAKASGIKTTTKRTAKQSKKVSADDETGTQEPHGEKGSRVLWDDSRTNWLVDWLEDNPEDRQKLFSDSSHDAKKENRPRRVAKGSKTAFHTKMAVYIFSVDADLKVREEIKGDTKKYAKAVENRITHLKRKYRGFNHELGRTGAGLSVDEIRKDESLSNLLGKLLLEFPAWERLHGFWRTLPSFNPHAVSSEPGQDLEAEALGVLFGEQEKAQEDRDAGEGLGAVGGEDLDGLSEVDVRVQHTDEGHTSDGEVDNLKDLTLDVTENKTDLEPSTSVALKPRPHPFDHHRTPSVSSSAGQSSRSTGPGRKGSSSKRTRVENSLEASVSEHGKLFELARGSYEFKTATIAAKRQKMELKAKQECEGQRYAAEEKALAAKERMRDKELKHQREEFEHQERMMKYRLELARLGIRSPPQPALGGGTSFSPASGSFGQAAQSDVYPIPDTNFDNFSFPVTSPGVGQSSNFQL
ncbi:hypothetical protein EDB83DRAFT_2516085 [Lactarius deliciosus]|nr:hypothetical protein EDB83DRAFT_2516085 [Lactarius deliciosus]